MSNKNLPQPSAEALAISEQLQEKIRLEISNNNGVISFQRFMELVLYAPGLGYYSAGSNKIGAAGDFITAPEISPLFARCIANQCQQVLQQLKQANILECGAGTGSLAAELLLALEEKNCLPEKYFILEASADLRQRQQQLLQEKTPHLLKYVAWLNQLPQQEWSGIILANEVLDAMPVCRFKFHENQITENVITIKNQQFHSEFIEPITPQLTQTLQEKILPVIQETQTKYISEINLSVKPWLQSMTEKFQQGLILLIDYGFPRHEFYHPDRSMGTLMCHYRHHAHSDFLQYIGLQDITAHVDFTQIAEAAVALNLHVTGYTSQSAFLLNCGLLDFMHGSVYDDTRSHLALNQQVQKLTAPNEMGELFKVIGLTRNLNDMNLIGFSAFDRRHHL